jgi:hypothetical protein
MGECWLCVILFARPNLVFVLHWVCEGGHRGVVGGHILPFPGVHMGEEPPQNFFGGSCIRFEHLFGTIGSSSGGWEENLLSSPSNFNYFL